MHRKCNPNPFVKCKGNWEQELGARRRKPHQNYKDAIPGTKEPPAALLVLPRLLHRKNEL